MAAVFLFRDPQISSLWADADRYGMVLLHSYEEPDALLGQRFEN